MPEKLDILNAKFKTRKKLKDRECSPMEYNIYIYKVVSSNCDAGKQFADTKGTRLNRRCKRLF